MNRSLYHPILSLGLASFALGLSGTGYSQQVAPADAPTAVANRSVDSPLTEREKQLLERLDVVEQRLALLEAKMPGCPASDSSLSSPSSASAVAMASPPQQQSPSTPADNASSNSLKTEKEGQSLPGFLAGTTLNFNLDAYYGYNFNRPVGRVNLLRAYDVLSNSFSLNQANIVIERAPDPHGGRPFGLRLDLQYGQATETVQGSAANEPRPQVYRPIWQAYGTYVAPVGHGLTLDFGKFASSLGFETNYTKDDLNYSRSYFFNFLPFYHFGLRAKYPVNDKLAVMYHLMNGIQQSEGLQWFQVPAFRRPAHPEQEPNLASQLLLRPRAARPDPPT